MRIIISNQLSDNFNNFKVVSSFKEVLEYEDVSVLIIHDFAESDFDAGVFISRFHSLGINNIVYMSKVPHTIVKMCIRGIHGIVCEDDFFLEDEEELEEYLKQVGVGLDLDSSGVSDCTDLSASSVSIQVIRDFVEAFARDEARLKTPAYLAQVNQAVTDLSNLTKQQELQISTMGTSAIEIFKKASSIIKNIDKKREEVEKQLQALSASQGSATPQTAFPSSSVFFPPYNYMGTKRVLVIRELSPCRYLTSFILGYEHHLHFDLNKRVKLIFVHQKGTLVASKYLKFCSISKDSMSIATLYDNEIVATNHPIKTVMRSLLDKGDDIFIVVDRLYGSDPIVTGKTLKIIAISGASDLERFKVKAKDCICSVSEIDDSLYCIPTVRNYVKEIDARYAAYSQLCGNIYEDLDRRLGLDMM